MSANYGPFDRTTLNNLSPNLDIGDVADPALRLEYFQYLADYGDALYSGVKNELAGLVSGTALSQLGVINVKDYNASGSDTTTTGNITAGTNRLTVASTSTFAQGQGISIAGAGAAGTTLVTTIVNISNLVITLADNAVTTVVSAVVNHDDTAGFNAACARGGVVIAPSGTYMIDADNPLNDGSGGIYLPDNTTLILHPNAIIKAKTSSSGRYNIIRIEGSSRVKVIGGTIQGDRETHIGGTGEQGYGISVTAASDITIQGVRIKDCWGDGIVLKPDVTDVLSYCEDIYIKNVVCDNNRRQGLTIASAYRVFVSGSQFNNTNGTPPQAGIDIESDVGYVTPKDILIENCQFNDNTSFDVVMGYSCENIIITGCVMKGCLDKPIDVNSTATVTNLTIETNQILGGGAQGIVFAGVVINGLINGNTIKNTATSSGAGIYIGSASDKVIISNNQIMNVYDGIFIGTTVSGYTINGNIIKEVYRALFPFVSINDSIISNNVIENVTNNAITMRMTRTKVIGNKMKNVGQSGMLGAPVSCTIESNDFIDNGTDNAVTFRSFAFDNVSASDNFVRGNYFRNSNTSHIAIRAFVTPSVIPSVFSNNDLRYSATSLSLDPLHINDNNFLLNRLENSTTWNPGSLADGAGETSAAITVTGAAFGDYVIVAAPYDLQGICCNGYVSAVNTVRIRLQNETGVVIDLASGLWKVKVIKT